MMMQRFAFALALGLAAVPAQAIVYDIDFTIGTFEGAPFRVTGTIETDGTLGFLNGGNFGPAPLTFPVASSSATLDPSFPGFTFTFSTESGGSIIFATADTLSIDFNAGSEGVIGFGRGFDIDANTSFQLGILFSIFDGGSGSILAFEGQVDPSNTASDVAYFTFNINQPFVLGNAQVAAVPLPAALPLLATGMLALGALGWRRRRAA